MSNSEQTETLTVGIIGLGLIGGSFAKAYKAAGHRVLGDDMSDTVAEFAIMAGAVDERLTVNKYSECDAIFIAVYPEATIETIKRDAPTFPKSVLVIDLCGTKDGVCRTGFEQAEKYGFTFVGGHPMAGTHNSGFKYSRADMFVGAPMVIVPPRYDDIELLERVKKILMPVGFGSISVTSAAAHDKMIAFTSQLAHIVSSAYIKSPTAEGHNGFSAGSYRDMTRVAWLNPDMWTELFIENRENLLFELECIIDRLTEYKDAISNVDRETLYRLLDDGRRKKEEVDGVTKN